MLTLRPGVTWAVEISQVNAGFILENVLRVGRREHKRTRVGTYRTEEDLWVAWEAMGQDRLAKLGLEKTKA